MKNSKEKTVKSLKTVKIVKKKVKKRWKDCAKTIKSVLEPTVNTHQPTATATDRPLLTPLLSSVKGGADQKSEEKIKTKKKIIETEKI